MQTKTSKTPEVILSAWEIQCLSDAGEWETVGHEATKGEAVKASMNFIASGCTVRVRWSA